MQMSRQNRFDLAPTRAIWYLEYLEAHGHEYVLISPPQGQSGICDPHLSYRERVAVTTLSRILGDLVSAVTLP